MSSSVIARISFDWSLNTEVLIDWIPFIPRAVEGTGWARLGRPSTALAMNGGRRFALAIKPIDAHQVWHPLRQEEPAHRWLREQVRATLKPNPRTRI